MERRRDLPRRRPLLLHVDEIYTASDDSFGVIVDVGWLAGGELHLDTLGGYIRGWSTMPPEIRELVRRDLRAVAARDLQAWRRG